MPGSSATVPLLGVHAGRVSERLLEGIERHGSSMHQVGISGVATLV